MPFAYAYELFDELDDLFNEERFGRADDFQITYEPDVFNDKITYWVKLWLSGFNRDNNDWDATLTVENSDVLKGFHIAFAPRSRLWYKSENIPTESIEY